MKKYKNHQFLWTTFLGFDANTINVFNYHELGIHAVCFENMKFKNLIPSLLFTTRQKLNDISSLESNMGQQ